MINENRNTLSLQNQNIHNKDIKAIMLLLFRCSGKVPVCTLSVISFYQIFFLSFFLSSFFLFFLFFFCHFPCFHSAMGTRLRVFPVPVSGYLSGCRPPPVKDDQYPLQPTSHSSKPTFPNGPTQINPSDAALLKHHTSTDVLESRACLAIRPGRKKLFALSDLQPRSNY